MTEYIKKTCLLSCVILAMLSISACGKGEKNAQSATQVAAKVDGAEISMHQINQLMKSAQNVTPENMANVRQQILEKLIDQQIIIEKANKDNLDRSPEVMTAIEAAKRDILARAYLQKMVASNIKVTDAEVKSYYTEHPGLFANRRIYNLQDIGLEKTNESSGVLSEYVEQKKSMPEIAESLKARNIKFSATTYTRPAEQIPLDILPKLQSLNEGDVVVVELGNVLHVMRLVSAQNAAIDLTTATPFIKNYFVNTRGKKLVEDEMKKFREQAKIEYVGDFSGKATENVAKPAESKSPQNDKKDSNSAIEAGVAGLK